MSLNLNFNLKIYAPVEQVYRAFTNATILRQWFCDFATVEAKPGGRIYLWWHSGRYLVGEFVEAVINKSFKISCRGCHEGGSSEIAAVMQVKDKVTHIRLTESGLTNQKVSKEVQKRWEKSLMNLKSYLEDGLDLRFINRPMLGILFGDFNEKIASELGVPVKEGIRLTDVVKGLGAEKAGLKKDDVIVEIGGVKTTDFSSLVNVLQHKTAGDMVDVIIYRGKEKLKLPMELSKRPTPKVAKSPKALAGEIMKKYDEFNKSLAACYKGISEDQAARPPKKGEWSANEVLAHLIHTERGWQDWISDMISYQERISDGYGDNIPARIRATVEVFGTSKELLKELKNTQMETIKFIANLPPKIAENKGMFWLMAYNMTQFATHTEEHIEQIRSALKK